MKLNLLPFQETAVSGVLSELRSSAKTWMATRDDPSPRTSAFALSSVTGSGKTVIAATVLEAVLTGSDTFSFNPVPGATILWVNYDPSLNSQTVGAFQKYADRINGSQLVVIDGNFSEDTLKPGTIYFLSLNLLGAGGKLTKPTESRPFTFWDTLTNTIKADDSVLYVIVDEAHVGMKTSRNKDNTTILQRLVKGEGKRPAVPILWGISATPKRFRESINELFPGVGGNDVTVDPADVRDSGLLKQQISLTLPGESQQMWTTLLGEAIKDVNASAAAWRDYCSELDRGETVVPLMVVQLPDRKDGTDTAAEDRLIGEIVGRLATDLDGFTPDCVAHVLGDRSTIDAKTCTVPKVEPAVVADDTRIRVLLAKESVSAGWDCPRAEVLLSLRPLRDETAITQLLGRMVRTPLARTTEVERLDMVTCYVPHFDLATARKVVDILTGDKEPDGRDKPSSQVTINARMLGFNPNVAQEVRDFISTMPSVLPPQAKSRPVPRFKEMVAKLARHGIDPTAGKTADAALCAKLDGLAVQYKAKVAAKKADVLKADTIQILAGFGVERSESKGQVEADLRTVRSSFNISNRALSGTGLTYYKHLREQARASDSDIDERDLRAQVAGIGLVPDVIAALDEFCEQYVADQFQLYQDIIDTKKPEVIAEFEAVRKQARQPQSAHVDFKFEKSYGTTDTAGKPLSTVELHVYSDEAGLWPIEEKLARNTWESAVLRREIKHDTIRGWYRNPSAAGADSLRIAFDTDGRWRSFQPDFIFVHETEAGLRAAIVDPHYTLDKDALAHIWALAAYAEEHSDILLRVDSLADPTGSGTLRRLRLSDPDVRKKARAATSANALYASDAAENYIFPADE